MIRRLIVALMALALATPVVAAEHPCAHASMPAQSPKVEAPTLHSHASDAFVMNHHAVGGTQTSHESEDECGDCATDSCACSICGHASYALLAGSVSLKSAAAATADPAGEAHSDPGPSLLFRPPIPA